MPHTHAHSGHSHAADAAHSGHSHDHSSHAHGHAAHGHPWAAAGFVLGIAAVASVGLLGSDAVDETVSSFLQTFGVLVLESAPALLLGYALAGVVPFLLTASRTAALGEGGRLTQSLRGVAFGLPLPVCSCGVLPLYESLIRKGAPPVAASPHARSCGGQRRTHGGTFSAIFCGDNFFIILRLILHDQQT